MSPRAPLRRVQLPILILRAIVIWATRLPDPTQRLIAAACSFLHIAPDTLRTSRLPAFLITLRARTALMHLSSALVNILELVISSLGLLGREMRLIVQAWYCNVCMRLAWIWVGITPITIVGCPSKPITP